jgi:hypothetical protein
MKPFVPFHLVVEGGTRTPSSCHRWGGLRMKHIWVFTRKFELATDPSVHVIGEEVWVLSNNAWLEVSPSIREFMPSMPFGVEVSLMSFMPRLPHRRQAQTCSWKVR